MPDSFGALEITGYKRFDFHIQLGVVEPGYRRLVSTETPADLYRFEIGLNKIQPSSGPLNGGNIVHIFGLGLTSVSRVCFGEFSPHPVGECSSKIKVFDDSAMTAVVPNGKDMVAEFKSKTVQVWLQVSEPGYKTIATDPTPYNRYTYK